jgi:multicomponent Na+:H+ antiporter subunit C
MIDMSPNLVLVGVIVVLVTAGVYLLLERSLSRVLIGIILIGNGANLLFLVAGGAAGRPPIVGLEPEGRMSDPLPQAMVLTAIVITLGMTAFLLAMAYRSWQLHRHDEVQDDLEDRRIARLAARDERAFADDDTEDSTTTLDEEAAETRDETDEGEPSPAAAGHDDHDRPTGDRGQEGR